MPLLSLYVNSNSLVSRCLHVHQLDAFPYGESLQTAVTLNYASYVRHASIYSYLHCGSFARKYSSFSLLDKGLGGSAKPEEASIRTWAIIIAMSCLGTLNSTIYTFSRGMEPPPPLFFELAQRALLILAAA